MIGEGPRNPQPLRVTACLYEGIVCNGLPMLDGLLAWVVSARARLVPVAADPANLEKIEIPIQRAPGGRFHLCSAGFGQVAARETRYKNRRAPWQEYARLGSDKIKRVQINVAEDKSYRVPYAKLLMDKVDWWCVGDQEQIADLLTDVHYLGRYRGSGSGRVRLPWAIEPCAPWDGFPLLRDGMACRALPLDWPGLAIGATAFRTLTYPYWSHTSEDIVAVPDAIMNARMMDV